jgi:muramoyltetrapeptide carboxypeptidase
MARAALLVACLAVLGAATVLPPRLNPGDTVAFVSPCSPPCYLVSDCPDGFVKDVEAQFKALGLNVVWGKNAFETDHYLAGTDSERAADLNDAFSSPNIKAIIATRGGEGSARMLQLLNFSSFPPKIIMGYSDMTAVINSVHQTSGFVTFHGPMGISNWSLASNGQFFKQVVMDGLAVNWTTPAAANPYTIRPGVAKGKLIGSNLSILTNILMSKYAPLSAFVGNILFIEDVDEQPYKIDRLDQVVVPKLF